MSDIIPVPVAVHRWFAEGEGWPYHPILKPYFHDLVDLLGQHLKSPDTEENFERNLKGKGILLTGA
jgi:hypothetical protein